MGRADPFIGYSWILRLIVFGAIPAFLIWQAVRLRRALHVFQLEGYKRERFLQWCGRNRRRALFLRPATAKKPLVMTGRAWRLWATSIFLSAGFVLIPPVAAHLWLGAPADLVVWAAASLLTFVAAPWVLAAADVVLVPVQAAINLGYMRRAERRLTEVSPVVVGVTGSFGKTSTKFAVAAALETDGGVLATPASFNTPLGVCRTINEALRKHHEYFVVEMGAYHVGEIAELCRFVRPRIGVLTAIGPAHLERFGSLDAVERAKYELIAALPPGGTAVMNVDDIRVRRLADQTHHVPVMRYGVDPQAMPDVTAGDVTISSDGTSFVLTEKISHQAVPVQTRLLGKFAVLQVLAATGVALSLGLRLEEIATRLSELQPVDHRLQLIRTETGVVVIDDSFNSNPDGAAAALDVLEQMPGERRVVVSPGIVELGELQAQENARFGARAAEVADVVIAVAPLNREALVAGAQEGDPATTVVVVDNLAAATEHLRTFLRPGDVVLFENDLPDQYEA